MIIAELRLAGSILGRAELAEKALAICSRVAASGNYKDAIRATGEMHVIYRACSFDDYWEEKASAGAYAEEFKMETVIFNDKPVDNNKD